MSAKENTNKLYWLAYCDTIKKQIGEFGSKNALFFGTKGLRGPPVGCDKAYLNYGVYNVADSLLAADNLFYTPGSTESYSRALLSYLNWVDVGGNPSDAAKSALNDAITYDNACQENVKAAAKAANSEYTELKNLGLVGEQVFADWVENNYPGYQNAVTQRNASAGQVKAAQMALSGPLSAQWNTDFDRISTAINTFDKPLKTTMPITSDAPPSATEILNATTAKKTLPVPTNLLYRPEYAAPEYVSTVKSWQSLAAKAPTKANTAKLSLSNARNVKEDSFGQTRGSVGFSYGDIIGVQLGADSDHEEKTLNTSDTENDIDITMFWDSIKAAAVSPGVWNIPNPKGTYPKLKTGAPDSVRTLVKPSQLWMIQNLGYEVKFSGSIKTTFEKTVKDVKSGGGAITFFGIPISLGAHGSSTQTNTTHVGTYDGSSGVFTIAPEPDVGFATIIAVVGEKVETF